MRKLIAGLAAAAFCGAAFAQYPQKPIRLVVPFPPSGAADLSARVVAQPLSAALGQPIILDNKAGADGAIAGNEVIKAAPDGYTLLFATNTGLCAAPTLRKSPPYDPTTEFTPISFVGRFGFFVFTHTSVPGTTLREFLDHVRANPGKINYGTGNSTSVVATAQLSVLERLNMVAIPYKGDAPATADLVAGRIQLLIGTPGTVQPFVKEGKVRALAAMLPARSPLMPDVPTMAEAGQKGLSIMPWAGIFGPAKMPRDVVDRLAREIAVVLARPEVREGLGRYAFEPQSSSPEELGAFLKEQLDAWRRTIRDVGIIPD